MRRLLRLMRSPWFWILAPGGTIIAGVLYLYQRGKARQAALAGAQAGSSAFNADPLAAAEAAATKAANWAKAYADTLRGTGVTGDPLAEAALGLSGGALAAPTSPTDVAANAAKAKSLRDDETSAAAALAADVAGYAANHNGGQSQAQEAGIEAREQARISSDEAALAGLGATS